jgi:hypothetical protein
LPSPSTQFDAAVSPATSEKQPWLYFNLLSLDAPSVAISWQLLFAKCSRIEIQPITVIVLGLTVWLIYVADRLLDVLRDKAPLATSRHQFHHRHKTAIAVSITAASLLLAASLPQLRPALLHEGFGLAAIVGLYFAGIHLTPGAARKACPKEFVVGTVFAVGTCLAPCAVDAEPGKLILPAILFAVLCCLNCSAIEVWEWTRFGASPQSRPHPSALWFARRLRPIAVFVALVAAFLFFSLGANLLFAALAISAFALLWLDKEQYRLSNDLLRVLADIPLLSPLLLIGIR